MGVRYRPRTESREPRIKKSKNYEVREFTQKEIFGSLKNANFSTFYLDHTNSN